MSTSNGQCKCGAVRYSVTAKLNRLVNCHCKRCREMNGTAFSSYVVVKSEDFALSQGEHLLQSFAVTERIKKHFCSNCGTPVYNSNPVRYPGLTMLYLGLLKDANELQPTINIFCESKLDWVDTLSLIESVNAGPPARA